MPNNVASIVKLAARFNIPTIYPWKYVVVRDGRLLSYGPDLKDIVRRGANYFDRVLRGAKAADLPIQVPVKWELAINRTAQSLGLAVHRPCRRLFRGSSYPSKFYVTIAR